MYRLIKPYSTVFLGLFLLSEAHRSNNCLGFATNCNAIEVIFEISDHRHLVILTELAIPSVRNSSIA